MKHKYERPEKVQYMTFNFKVPITSDEAYEVLNNPKGIICKKLKKYFYKMLRGACEKVLQECNENVTEETKDLKEEKEEGINE